MDMWPGVLSSPPPPTRTRSCERRHSKHHLSKVELVTVNLIKAGDEVFLDAERSSALKMLKSFINTREDHAPGLRLVTTQIAFCRGCGLQASVT